MIATRARASACIGAAFAAVLSACGGDARRDAVGVLPDLRIGTFAATGGRLGDLLTREPLIAVDWDGRPAYRLAESASESADGMVLTVTIRPNIRFHTGEIVTAENVRDLLSAKADLMDQVQAIDLDGDRTIKIRLEEPYSLDLADLSEYTIHDDRNPRIRTGPFRIVSSGPDAVFDRFPQYHQGMPSVARIEIHQYPNHRAAWTAMMRGEVNFLHEVNREAIDFIQAGTNIRAYSMLRPYYYAVVFNQQHPVLRRREVRLALNEGIDRAEIVQNGMHGHGRAADGPFWPYHWAYPVGRNTASYNPEAAKVRLDSLGLGTRAAASDRMPSRFEFTCLLMQGDTRFERIALVIQRQLFDIGVDMRIVPVPPQEFGARLKQGDYDAFLFELASGRTLTWAHAWWRSPGLTARVATSYAGADRELDRMRGARTEEAVRMAVADVMRVFREDPPALFLVWPYETRAVDASINVPHEPERDIFGTLWQARPAVQSAELER